MPQPLRRRDVRTPAEVSEVIGISIGADDGGPCRCIHLRAPLCDGPDDLGLERLISEEGETSLDGVLVSDEGLVLFDDVAHRRLDASQIIVTESLATGELEVVIEAILDNRPDGEVGSRPEPEDRLGQDVCSRVPQYLPASRRRGCEDFDQAAIR